MNSFIHFKRGECPICKGARKDCRKNNHNNLIHCRDSSTTSVSGYRFVKEDALGFGIWTMDDGRDRDWSSEHREEWQWQQEARRQQQEIEDAHRRAKLLTVEERDRQYRILNQQLTLSNRHRGVLGDRGLTDAEVDFVIEQGAVRTWNPRQRINGVSPDLAGINPSTRQLTGVDGIALYAFDPAGRVTGAQLKTDNDSFGKYIWLSSATKSGNGPQLPSGELPLFCWKHPNATTVAEVWLCEGALKSLLTALSLWRQGRTDVAVIGTASAARYGEQTLKSCLQQLGAPTVRVMPDAGAVVNPTIHKANQQTLERCQQWGYQTTVGFWGQFDKTQPDIDELDSFDAIAYLTPEEFLALDPESEAAYKELTQLTAPAWKEVNTPNLDFESLGMEKRAIYIVSSAKGTGKTSALVPFVPKFTNVYACFSRIALGREECNRIGGLDWKDDLKSFAGSLKVGFCADSAYAFPPRHLKDNGLLLIDEADQVFEHMFGDTCNKNGKRPLILAAFKAQLNAAIAGGGMALFMSADITDKEVEYIQRLAPAGCPVRLIVNHYKPQLGDVYFDDSKAPDGQIKKLLEDLEADKPCFVIDDLKGGVKGCKSIAEYVRKLHPEWVNEIVEINSDTSGDPSVIGYLKNINAASKTTRLLCCSPSVVSGVSIENGHFEEVYAFLNGVLTVSHALQAIARVRGAESINVWAAEEGLIYAGDHSLLPEQIKDYYKRNYESNCKHLLAFGVEYDPLTDEWESPHFDLYCKYAAYRNCCMSDLRSRLKQRLEDEGYEVLTDSSGPSDIVKAGLQDAWATLEIKHALDVAGANILTDVELKSLENRTLDPQQKLDVEKTFLLKAFGQELIDSMIFEHDSGEVLTGFAAMVLKDKRGEYRKQLEAFYLLTSDAGTAIAKDLKAEQRQLDHGKGRFAGDIRWNTRARKARGFLGLHEFLNPESWYGPADFASLAEKAKQHAGRVKDALGFAVGKMTAGQIFGELMNQLGLVLNKEWANERTPNGHRFKLRQIDPDSWRYAQMYVNYRDSLTKDSAVSETDFSPSKSTSKADHPSGDYLSERVGGGDQGLSHTGHGLEVVPLPCFSEEILTEVDAQNPVGLEAIAVAPQQRGYEQSSSPSMPARAVEILTRAGDWLQGYLYLGRRGEQHQLADGSGYRGIFVDDDEFRFVDALIV